MILYLDTSSLVKLYVEETGSSEVVEQVRGAAVAATSLVAYAEARAAFARRFRENAFSHEQFSRLKEFFATDWSCFFILGVTKELVLKAGDLAEKHSLRGFDAIHLASALTLRQETSAPIRFSCFDEKLETAFNHEILKYGK